MSTRSRARSNRFFTYRGRAAFGGERHNDGVATIVLHDDLRAFSPLIRGLVFE
jgi:hypothetical protein